MHALVQLILAWSCQSPSLSGVHALEQVKELLLPYGHLKAFNLVMDKSTGNSKASCCSLSTL